MDTEDVRLALRQDEQFAPDLSEIGIFVSHGLRRRTRLRRFGAVVGVAAVVALIASMTLVIRGSGDVGVAKAPESLDGIVGIQWVSTGLTHDGKVVPLTQGWDLQFSLSRDGSANLGRDCMPNTARWIATGSGVELTDLVPYGVYCYLIRPSAFQTEISAAAAAVKGPVALSLGGSTLTISIPGYQWTLTNTGPLAPPAIDATTSEISTPTPSSMAGIVGTRWVSTKLTNDGKDVALISVGAGVSHVPLAFSLQFAPDGQLASDRMACDDGRTGRWSATADGFQLVSLLPIGYEKCISAGVGPQIQAAFEAVNGHIEVGDHGGPIDGPPVQARVVDDSLIIMAGKYQWTFKNAEVPATSSTASSPAGMQTPGTSSTASSPAHIQTPGMASTAASPAGIQTPTSVASGDLAAIVGINWTATGLTHNGRAVSMKGSIFGNTPSVVGLGLGLAADGTASEGTDCQDSRTGRWIESATGFELLGMAYNNYGCPIEATPNQAVADAYLAVDGLVEARVVNGSLILTAGGYQWTLKNDGPIKPRLTTGPTS